MEMEKEIREFFESKYGTSFPEKVESGYIKWLHILVFTMMFSPRFIQNVPVLTTSEYEQKMEKIRNDHWKPPKRISPEKRAETYHKHSE